MKHAKIRGLRLTVAVALVALLAIPLLTLQPAVAQLAAPDYFEFSYGEPLDGWVTFDYSADVRSGAPHVDVTFVFPDPTITVPYVT